MTRLVNSAESKSHQSSAVLDQALSRLPFSRHEQLEISTSPDDDHDAPPKDRQNIAEYRFDACVWDSSVLVGLGVLSWQESLAVAFCGLWSILVEGFFVLILYDNMTETVFETSLVQEMKDWRIHFGVALSKQVELCASRISCLLSLLGVWKSLFWAVLPMGQGQNMNYIDGITGQPLIMGVCGMSNSLMNGNVQAEIFETLFKYGIREEGNEDLRWPLLPVGAWLALIALLVWIFTVLKEMSCACGFGIALASLPRGSGVSEGFANAGRFHLSTVSLHRVLVLIIFNMLPRLGIALVAISVDGCHRDRQGASICDLRFLASSEFISWQAPRLFLI